MIRNNALSIPPFSWMNRIDSIHRVSNLPSLFLRSQSCPNLCRVFEIPEEDQPTPSNTSNEDAGNWPGGTGADNRTADRPAAKASEHPICIIS